MTWRLKSTRLGLGNFSLKLESLETPWLEHLGLAELPSTIRKISNCTYEISLRNHLKIFERTFQKKMYLLRFLSLDSIINENFEPLNP